MHRLALALIFAVACRAEPSTGDDRTRVVFKHGKITTTPEPIGRLIAQFEADHPDIDVIDEELPSNTDEQHRFYVINLEGESADFDVFALDVIWVSELSRAGWIRPLGHLLTEEDRTDFFAGTVDAVSFGGRVNAVPWFIGAGILYYRKDLLAKHGEKPPKTWEELVAIAQRITAVEEDLYGFVWQGKQYEGLVCNALEYMWSHGGRVLEGDLVRVDSAENQAALRFMHDLVHRYRVSPELVMTLTEEPSRRIFQAGRALFMRNWPYAWKLLEAEGSLVRGKVGAAMLPAFEGHSAYATLGGWHLGVNRYSRHPEAAEELVAFLASRSAQKYLTLHAEYHPTRRSLYQDPELLRHDPFLEELAPILERARPRPVTPFYIMISQVLQLEISGVLAGIRRPEEALSSAGRQIEHLLEVEE